MDFKRIIWIMSTSVKSEKGVMDYFAGEARTNRILCEAFCIENHLLKFTANFYFKVKKPSINGKVFDKIEDAFPSIDDQLKNSSSTQDVS